MKKINKIQIINILLILISTLILLWITNLHGFLGLCRWNPKYKTILVSLWVFDLINLIIFGISFSNFKKIKKIKLFNWISIFTSSVLALLLIAMYIAFIIPVLSKSTNEYFFTEVATENKLNDEEPLLSLAVSSDPHWGSENSNNDVRTQILKNIGQANYDAFLCLGDIAEIGSTESFYEEASSEFDKYLNGTPIHVVLGNHDALINGTVVFKKYFQKNHDNYYSRIDYDDFHMYMIH